MADPLHVRLGRMALLSPLVLPMAAGVWGTLTLARSRGWDQGFGAVLDWPGLPRAVALSLGPGLLATLLSLGLAFLILAFLTEGRGLAAFRRSLAPLLALPHAAAALGLAFLIAPSGWIARALAPLTGWQSPPDWALPGDAPGLALTLGLVVKELPFLLLMALAAAPGLDLPRRRLVAASLGHGRLTTMAVAIWPALYPRLRLPVAAVLIYGMSTVDMGRLLGPGLPPPLSVQAVDWLSDPGLTRRPAGAAAAALQLLLCLAALGLWRGGERLGRSLLQALAQSGRRGRRVDAALFAPSLILAFALPALGLAALTALALWSMAGLWSFPDLWPATLTLQSWAEAAPALLRNATTTAALALASVLLALALTLAWLEFSPRPPFSEALFVLPLLLPQIAVLPGLTSAAILLGPGFRQGLAPVLVAHLAFVAPYVFLTLSGPWRRLDSRVFLQAETLGASRWKRFLALRLPLLTAPLLAAFAVGFAVSVAQYLAVLLPGGGRVTTLTTETVALATGGNRRLAGAMGLAQALLPLVVFVAALTLPRLIFRHRAGMRGLE